jgi:hypothetical protein
VVEICFEAGLRRQDLSFGMASIVASDDGEEGEIHDDIWSSQGDEHERYVRWREAPSLEHVYIAFEEAEDQGVGKSAEQGGEEHNRLKMSIW